MDRHSPARVKSEIAHTPQRAGSTWTCSHSAPQKSWGNPAGDALAPASSCLASSFLADFPETSRERGIDTLLPPCKWTTKRFQGVCCVMFC